MYREQIKVLDCTIRDGGLVNDHFFDDDFVRALYAALTKAGVDYMEFGYRCSKELFPPEKFGAWKYCDDFVRALYAALTKAGVDYMEFGYRCSKELFPPEKYGAWKFCDDEKIAEVIDGIESNMKISVMADAHRIQEQTFRPVDETPIDMFRVATYVKDVDKAISLTNQLHELGYETTVNIMAISKESEFDLVECLKQLASSPAGTVYVVDSFGALYSEQIEYYVKLYQQYLPGKEIGIHCHNNQQLAFGNTIEAIIHNANYLDASLYGIGRGAGNCCLELLMGFLKNPKYKLTPVLKVLQDYMISMRETMEWGYLIPDMITGNLNEHPRHAIGRRAGPDRDKFAEFYEEMIKDV